MKWIFEKKVDSYFTKVVLQSSQKNGSKKFRLIIKYVVVILGSFLLISYHIHAQQNENKEAKYREVLTSRSEKIVNNLNIKDEEVYQKVVAIIADQYFKVNSIQDNTKESIQKIKKEKLSADQKQQLIQQVQVKKETDLKALHKDFLSRLNKDLSRKQIDKVKDGMTYNVLNVTYNAYQEMIPGLSNKEKKKIYKWLIEAREKAMDEGSSEDKHKMFGKYKGRINNYLASRGYNLKEEEKKWQERIKEEQS